MKYVNSKKVSFVSSEPMQLGFKFSKTKLGK